VIHEPTEQREAISLLTVRDAARLLALSRSTLYNLMERGALAYVKIGRARRIPHEELQRLIHESLINSHHPSCPP
jgi:excisionase family DNA binding protein